jgi:acetylornithine/succinyldiaminopimelate/putrescine aminotransferase
LELLFPSTRFLKGIRDICDKNDWLMIADEVLTGLGRTGRMWGIEHYDVLANILVYGKNLSGGIAPLCGISARVAGFWSMPASTAG